MLNRYILLLLVFSSGISTLDAYLSKDIASQRFIQAGVHVYELKKVQALSMFLHHHLEVASILKHLQHLGTKDAQTACSLFKNDINLLLLESYLTNPSP